jgi:hypothetical protein
MSSRDEFRVEEAEVESCVVDDQFGAADEIEEVGGDVGKAGLVEKEIAADSVHRQGAGVDFAFRIQVAVEMPLRQAAVTHLDAADLDDAMPELVFEAGRFGVKEDRSHRWLSPVCALAGSLAAPQLVHAAIGQRVGTFVAGIPGMSPHPAPRDLMLAGKLGEPLPEVGILHRLPVGGAPAVAPPVADPLGDALLQVL